MYRVQRSEVTMAQAAPLSPQAPARMRLVCPAGTPPALRVAVDNGADDVYLGFKDETNARNFAGLNFDDRSIRDGIEYAHRRGRAGAGRAQHLPAAVDLAEVARRRGPRRGPRRGRDHRGRRGSPRLCREDASATAAAPLRAGLGHQPRGDQLLPRALRHQARRAAARALRRAGGEGDPAHAGGHRGVRLREPVDHGRGALRAVVLRDGGIAQHPRRLLAGEGDPLAAVAAGARVAPRAASSSTASARRTTRATRRSAAAASW